MIQDVHSKGGHLLVIGEKWTTRMIVTGKMKIEPFLIEGAHIFFLSNEHSFGISVASIYGTDWQKEFAADFNFDWTNEKRLRDHNFDVSVSDEIFNKWLNRANCRIGESSAVW